MAKEAVLRVELDGLAYVLRGAGGEQRLRQISSLVKQKVDTVRACCPHYSTTRTAMLVALQTAEELLALQEEYFEMLEAANIT